MNSRSFLPQAGLTFLRWSLIGLSAAATGLLVTKVQNPVIFLLFFLGGGVLILLSARPELGMVLLIFILYTRFSEALTFIRELPALSTMLIGLLALIVTFRGLLFGIDIQGWQRPVLFLLTYGLLGLASALYAVDVNNVFLQLRTFVIDALLVLVIFILLRSAATLRQVVWSLLLAGIFLGTLSTYQQLTGTYNNSYWGFAQVEIANIVGRESGVRISGPGLGPNAYGQIMILLVPLALDRLWSEQKVALRFLAGWAFAVCVLTVIFTFSRGAFLSLVVVMLLMLIEHPPKPAVLLVTALLGILLFQFIPSRYIDRMATLSYLLPGQGTSEEEVIAGIGRDATQDSSFRGRLSENIVGINMSLDNLLFGVGMNNFKNHYLSYAKPLGLDGRGEERSAHNLYLEITAELGVFGLAWFIAICWVILRGFQKARLKFKLLGLDMEEKLVRTFTITIIAFLITSIYRHMAHPFYVWLFFALWFAIPSIAENESINRSIPTKSLDKPLH